MPTIVLQNNSHSGTYFNYDNHSSNQHSYFIATVKYFDSFYMPSQWIIDIEFPRLTFFDPFSLGHFFLIWYIVILSSFTLTNTMKLYILSILCIWIWFEFIDLSKSFEIRFKLSIRILIIWFIFRSSKHDEYATINVRSIQLNLKE